MPSNVFVADLGGTKCSAAMIDRAGRILHYQSAPVSSDSASAPVLQIAQLARELAQPRKTAEAFQAAAVSVPGLVRPNGTVWAPNLRGWTRMPLAKRLGRLLGVPVAVESDRNAAILGESWRGAARGKSDAILLMIGTGIGAGILSGGRIVRGAHELSGCAGWMTITRDGVPKAKDVGELESLAAGPAIANTARYRLLQGEISRLSQFNPAEITARHVAGAARAGDALALSIFQNAGRFLGSAVANLVSLFDPELIILGGGMAEAADLYIEALRRAMLERAQPLAARRVRIVVSKIGGRANLLGCASIAWKAAGLRTGRR